MIIYEFNDGLPNFVYNTYNIHNSVQIKHATCFKL